jgi:hypothetical protein
MVGALHGRRITWLVHYMVGALHGWCITWLAHYMVGALHGWCITWLVHYMVGALHGRQIHIKIPTHFHYLVSQHIPQIIEQRRILII